MPGVGDSLPVRLAARRYPGLQPQVREDAQGHRGIQDGGDDLQLARTLPAVSDG